MDASEDEMVRRGALPGHKFFQLVKTQLKIFSSQVVGDGNHVLFVPKDAVELNMSVAAIYQANY